MDPKELPPNPNLEQYKKQAKQLLKSCKRGEPAGLQRIAQHQPRPRKRSSSAAPPYALADAQFTIAREHGFESWPKFARHIDSMNRSSSAADVFAAAKTATIAGDAEALERLLRKNSALFREGNAPPYVPGGPGPDYSWDAQSIIARGHDFESWSDFEKHRAEAARKGSAIARFEAAVEAVIDGDEPTLSRLLGEDPALIRARSARKHHSTLLHYVGANGVEGFRQKTPKNALQIAQILLDAGAEIDAMADMYGGSTTLGLIATSIHPLLAGVQPALIETFIERGARVDGGFEEENTGGYTRGAVNGCLANGRFEAAELLARRGARLDLEGAAGLGRLDPVKSFFNDDGGLKPTATGEQLKMGFIWACEYGQREVVEFLLRRGIKPGEKHRGQTGLHWAAIGGHAGLVKLLIDHKFPADQKDDEHEGTPLGWALFGWGNKSDEAPSDGFYQSVELLVAAGAPVEPGHLAWVRVRADPRMLAALEGKQPSGVRLEI